MVSNYFSSCLAQNSNNNYFENNNNKLLNRAGSISGSMFKYQQ